MTDYIPEPQPGAIIPIFIEIIKRGFDYALLRCQEGIREWTVRVPLSPWSEYEYEPEEISA